MIRPDAPGLRQIRTVTVKLVSLCKQCSWVYDVGFLNACGLRVEFVCRGDISNGG